MFDTGASALKSRAKDCGCSAASDESWFRKSNKCQAEVFWSTVCQNCALSNKGDSIASNCRGFSSGCKNSHHDHWVELWWMEQVWAEMCLIVLELVQSDLSCLQKAFLNWCTSPLPGFGVIFKFNLFEFLSLYSNFTDSFLFLCESIIWADTNIFICCKRRCEKQLSLRNTHKW